MGLRQLLLDLPTTCSRQEALYTAAADLHDRGIRGWRNLELRTTDPTSTASIRRFTFTYWHPATVPAAPPNLSYHVLWERMDQPARTALLRLAPATVVTAQIENALTRVNAHDVLIRDPDGRYHLPRSLRLFLRALADEYR